MKRFDRNGPAKRFGKRNSGGTGRFNKRNKGFQRFRNDSSRFQKDKEMHEVECDKCGDVCRVPFKPTESRPVYCSACFQNKNGPRERESARPQRGPSDLDQINRKLDRILELLEE